MENWFREWFSSEEYLSVYNHRNEEDAEKLIKTILAKTNLDEGADVLDAACGAGRHAIKLAKKGFKVTAFDLSEELLKIGIRKSEEQGLNINFINADLREFSSDKKFSLILNVFTSFGYFDSDEDNFAFFNKLDGLLLPDGYFVFDYLNKGYLENNLNPYSERELDHKKITEFRKIENGRVVKKIVIDAENEVKTFYESVKLYSPERIIVQLKKLNLQILEVFGDYSGGSFDQNKSERLIILAQK